MWLTFNTPLKESHSAFFVIVIVHVASRSLELRDWLKKTKWKHSYANEILKGEGERNGVGTANTKEIEEMESWISCQMWEMQMTLYIVGVFCLLSTVNKKSIRTFEREWTQLVRGVGLGWHRVTFPFIVYRHDVTMADCILLTGHI